MPVDLKLLGKDGKQLFHEWKEKVKKHDKLDVQNGIAFHNKKNTCTLSNA